MCGSFCEPRGQTEFRDSSLRSAPDGGGAEVGSDASSRAPRPQFRNPDQVEGDAAKHEQPIRFREPAPRAWLIRVKLDGGFSNSVGID